MAQQFSDAARSELTAGISAGDTTITLADGSRFPEADAGTSAVGDGNLWFKAVLQDETGFEIVYVRTHAVATTPDTLSNVLRGQEGTTARSFAATSVIGVRLTAFDMASLWATMANKATDSIALTDAAGTATLPATAAASVASRLQVLRNNVKQAFADLAGKMSTAGGAFSNGISFGSATAASPSTVTRHIALYGTEYGFSITPERLNYVVNATATHRFMVGSTEVGSISSAGDLVMASNVTAYSDPRLKENFQRVQDPFYILTNLDGGTFNWRHGIPHIATKAGKRDYGLLTNQVKAVMPEIVTPSVEIDGEVYDTVCYEKLVPVLIEAVKELHGRIKELEGR